MGCSGCGHKYFRPPRTTVGAAGSVAVRTRPARLWKYTPRVAPVPAEATAQPAAPAKPKEG